MHNTAKKTASLEDYIITIVSETVGVEANVIKLDKDFTTYGVNSTDLLRFIIQIEKAFGFICSDEDFTFTGFKTINDLIRFSHRHMTANGDSLEEEA